MYLVAAMYETGDGVLRDLRLARFWYAAAARAGDEAAPGKVREIDARLASQPG
jgi:TPR repeat protein